MDGDPQMVLDSVLEQVEETPSVTVLNLWGGPPRRMFLRKHVDARLRPWES